jgi:Uma2 family endonuclease
MNAPIRPDETDAQVVPMTVEALRILDEQGFFDDDFNRHELIDGVLIEAPFPSNRHQYSSRSMLYELVSLLLDKNLTDRLGVQTGCGYIVGDFNHLGPDMMVVHEPREFRPWVASDVVVMIEIADETLALDLGQKARLYASAGIAEYWVLDVADKALIVHTEPTESRYGNIRTLRAPDRVNALLEPALSVAVADLF